MTYDPYWTHHLEYISQLRNQSYHEFRNRVPHCQSHRRFQATAVGHPAGLHGFGGVCFWGKNMSVHFNGGRTKSCTYRLTGQDYRSARRPCYNKGKDRAVPEYGSSRAWGGSVGRLNKLQPRVEQLEKEGFSLGVSKIEIQLTV